MRRVLPGFIPRLVLFMVLLSAPVFAEAEDLSFSRAVELAEERSEILLLQKNAVKSAALAVAEARSRLGPELTFEAVGGYMAHPPLTITVQPGDISKIPLIPAAPLTFPKDKPSGYFELSLQLSQPLYTWGKLHSSVQLAGLGLKSSRAELTDGERQVYQDLHTVYFSGVLARDSLDLLQKILDILVEIEEDRKEAFDLGSVNRLSVLEIQAQISEARRRIVQAEQAYATALEAIRLYTGLDPESCELTEGFRSEYPGFSETELKESALGSSAALEKARLDREQARANLNLIRGAANLRPDLSLNLSIELSGQTIPWSESGWEDGWDFNLVAGMGASGSLFDSGCSGHKIRQVEAALSAAQLAVDLLTKQIRLQIRQAFGTLQLRRAELEEARAAVAGAEEQAKNAGRAFEQQLLTREQRGMARMALLQQEIVLLQRKHSYELALYELESLAGLPYRALCCDSFR
jgi:outer membrane protein